MFSLIPDLKRFVRSLRKEQKEVIRQLVSGGDLLAVLPSGFGKSLGCLILRVQEAIRKKPSRVIIVCPLKSMVQDQIAEVVSMGFTAALLPQANLEDMLFFLIRTSCVSSESFGYKGCTHVQRSVRIFGEYIFRRKMALFINISKFDFKATLTNFASISVYRHYTCDILRPGSLF